MDQRLLIPSHYSMAKLTHNLKYDVSVDWQALGNVYAPGKGGYVNMHFAAGADHRGKSTLCSNAGEQELGIKFAHLILNWHKQCSFVWLHTLPWSPISIQIKSVQFAFCGM
jgi:hypothetical protein